MRLSTLKVAGFHGRDRQVDERKHIGRIELGRAGKQLQAAVRDGRYQRGIRTIAGRSVHFRGEPVTVDVQTPSSQPLLLHNVVADTGMDFDAALAKLEESRASAKSEAIVLDDDDDDDDSAGKRSTGGSEWLGRLKVTNVSGGGTRGFNGPADAERFGDRDGFRMLSENAWKPGGICLIIETGEASMRGLSVKTDTFLVYRPHRVQELVKWGGQLRAGQPTPDALAKRAWDKEFNGRSRAQTNYLLTGPVLQIYPQIIQAERANSASNASAAASAFLSSIASWSLMRTTRCRSYMAAVIGLLFKAVG